MTGVETIATRPMMSNPESFIDEVNDEVRRDNFYKSLRRYGWIGIVAVVALVGGASWNEWNKAKQETAAQALGDAVLSAMDIEGAAGLETVAADGAAASVLALLAAARSGESDAAAAAREALTVLAADLNTDAVYRDLAALKLVMLTAGETAASERITALTPLAVPGAPYRMLAEEQIALAEAEAGDVEAAISRLNLLNDDSEATPGLRQRASQLIVALGGKVE
jgi:hypothetical protein